LRLEIGLDYNDGVLLRKTSPEETTAWSSRCVSPGAKTERGMQFMIKDMYNLSWSLLWLWIHKLVNYQLSVC